MEDITVLQLPATSPASFPTSPGSPRRAAALALLCFLRVHRRADLSQQSSSVLTGDIDDPRGAGEV